MSAAATKFTTIREFQGDDGIDRPIGTQVVRVEPTLPDDASNLKYRVIIIGNSPLHHNVVWVDRKTRDDLASQEHEQASRQLALLNASADALG